MNAILQAFLDAMVNDDGSGTTGDLMDKTWWTDLIGRLDTVISLAGLSIEKDQTYYVSLTGSDTTGDGSLTQPWATIEHAAEALQSYRIVPGTSCVLQIDDGDYSFSSSIENLPEYLILSGKNSLLRQITSIQSSSGSSGDYSIVLNLFDVSSIEEGDECAIEDAIGGTNPLALVGTYEVTDVDTSNSRITIHAPITGDLPSGLVTATTHIYKTKLCPTGVSGIIADRHLTIKNLAILGDGSADTYGILPEMATVQIENVAIRGFGTGGIYCENGAKVMADGLYISDSGSYGVYCSGGQVTISSLMLARLTTAGIACQFSGTVNIPSAVIYNTGTGILCRHAGSVLADAATLQKSGTGVLASYGGQVQIENSSILNHSGEGVRADYGAFISARYSVITNNSSQVIAYNNSTIIVKYCTLTGATAIGAYARAFVNAISASITGAVDPTLNTQGNGYAYIVG